MNRACRGNTSKLIGLISGSLRPRVADRLRQHLESCAGCREAYERLTRTQQLCRRLGNAEPPSMPWRKVEAQIHWQLAHAPAGRRGAPLGPWSRRLLTFGAAATVGAAVALALVWFVEPGWSGQPAPRKVVVREPVRVPPPPAPEQELAAVPTMVQGDVMVELKGEQRPLRLEQPVVQGARVVTGTGRTALQWGEGSGLLLEHQSSLVVSQLMSRTQQLELEQGRVRVQRAKLARGESFSVVAHGVRAAVKGTVFDVAVITEAVRVEVLEGVVHVNPLKGGWDGVDVPAGYGVEVPFDAAHAPRLDPLGQATGPQVHLVPWPNLARMMATTGLLTLESVPTGAELAFDSRPVGNTNLSLRGAPGRHLVELFRDGKLVEKRWVNVAVASGPLTLRLRAGRGAPRMPARIHTYIRQRAVQIRACYERLLKRDPAVEGRLTFRIAIDEQGLVTETNLISDTFSDSWVGQCARQAIERWHFPPGKPVQVVYPFILRPQ